MNKVYAAIVIGESTKSRRRVETMYVLLFQCSSSGAHLSSGIWKRYISILLRVYSRTAMAFIIQCRHLELALEARFLHLHYINCQIRLLSEGVFVSRNRMTVFPRKELQL